MSVFTVEDVNELILSYIDGIRNIVNFKHICKCLFYMNYTIYKKCKTPCISIDVPNIEIETNNQLLRLNNHPASYTVKSITMFKSSLITYHIAKSRLVNVTHLDIRNFCDMFKNGIHTYFPNLTSLCIENFDSDISMGLEHVNLTTLKVRDHYKRIPYDKLQNLTELDVVMIQGYELKKLKHLKKLKVQCSFNSHDNVNSDYDFTNNPDLEYINISNTTPKKAITQLHKLKEISVLNMSDCNIMHLKELETLYISSVSPDITDQSLSTFTNLKRLYIFYNCGITDAAFINLKNINKLVIQQNDHISGINLIDKEYLTSFLIPCYISDDILSKLYRLRTLDLSNNSIITDEAISKLINLEKLHCGRNENITDKGILSLPNLKILDTGYNTNFSIKAILSIKSLREVFSNTPKYYKLKKLYSNK